MKCQVDALFGTWHLVNAHLICCVAMERLDTREGGINYKRYLLNRLPGELMVRVQYVDEIRLSEVY